MPDHQLVDKLYWN